MIVMIGGTLILATVFNDASKVLSLHSQFGNVSYVTSKNKRHILLLGDFHPAAMETFLTECFHADHGKIETDVVILRNSEPTSEISALLKDPQFDKKIIYIKGNPLLACDLKRCIAH